ncbi:ComF family protein [candidate division KSB1 bacterium]|nr:ComF family protein [candidate division KSB1 bacterium]
MNSMRRHYNAIFYDIQEKIHHISKALVDFVFPEFCIECKQRLSGKDSLLCTPCWENLPLFPQDHSITAEIAEKSEHNRYLAHAFAIYEFSETVQTMIHLLKYDHRPTVAVHVLRHMPTILRTILQSVGFDLIIPVPLHKKRVKSRGYNQSAVIGTHLSKILLIPLCESCLLRTRNTTSQTTLDINQRIENVAGAFKVSRAQSIFNKKILIVDDVITTGSTINACAKELLSYGAKEVSAFSLVKVK